MPLPQWPAGPLSFYSSLGMALSLLAGCDGTQTVSVTAEDFRFVPELVRVQSSVPITLTLYNAGREVHEFDSSVLMYAVPVEQPKEKPHAAPGLLIAPGQSVRMRMTPPPGTYLYICLRKGHADMTGTLVVE